MNFLIMLGMIFIAPSISSKQLKGDDKLHQYFADEHRDHDEDRHHEDEDHRHHEDEDEERHQHHHHDEDEDHGW